MSCAERSEVRTSGGMDVNSVEYWRAKSNQLERAIKDLSNHCMRVVEHHEDLLKKFKRNQDQYSKLKAKYQDQEGQIKKAREVLTPVSNELKALREKYEAAVQCQMKAESFAIQTTNRNKELKRQSQMLFKNLETANINVVDIDIDSLENDREDDGENDYIKKLDQQIDVLENEKISLGVQVKELNENLQDEKESKQRLKEKFELLKEELMQTKLVVKQQENLLQQVASTSEKVYQQYNNMEETYQQEVALRSEVEREAHKLSSQRDQARRESAMALSKVADNKKLMDAMLEIQELNAQCTDMKAEYERKIEGLENQLEAAKEVYNAESLQEENNELQEKFEASDVEVKRLHAQFTELTEKYKTLETKYEQALKFPIPQPPPAPPPPPPMFKAGGFLQKLVGRKGQRDKAKEKLKKGGVVTNDAHSKALEEMMKRINSGNIGLRPVLQRRAQSLPDKEESSAVTELQSLLTKMRKSRSEDDLSVFGDTGVEEESELGKLLRKRQDLINAKDANSSEKSQSGTEPPAVHSRATFRPVPSPRKLSTIPDDAEEV